MSRTVLGPLPTSEFPQTPALSLLPFSLGSSSNPYSSSEPKTANYFSPHPCPANVPGIPEGTVIASFRGRQLVSQTVEVPKSYRGIILSTSAPHQVSSYRTAQSTPWPPTPSASSIAASSSASISSSIDAETASRRSPRKSAVSNLANAIKNKVRGAGQVALSRPKTRQAPKREVKKKTFRLDSDDDDDDEGSKEAEHGKEERGQDARLAEPPRTPAKRSSRGAGNPASPLPIPGLPSIVVQEATPMKEPLPSPVQRLGKRRRGDDTLVKEHDSLPPVRPVVPPRSSSRSQIRDEKEMEEVAQIEHIELASDKANEHIIPSPATEDDPPAFSIVPTSQRPPLSRNSSAHKGVANLDRTAQDEHAGEAKPEHEEDSALHEEVDVRILRPSSTFSSFTLWTPDAPLAGFKSDELEMKADLHGDSGNTEVKTEGAASEEAHKVEDGGIKLRDGWWRTGGAGEGGDEIVRALGEWLGLVDTINEPVYLDGAESDSDDE